MKSFGHRANIRVKEDNKISKERWGAGGVKKKRMWEEINNEMPNCLSLVVL
jgi:hypothetical protein